MVPITGIYAAGFLLCLLAGVAFQAILRPHGRWVGLGTLPLGLCLLVVLLYPAGALVSSRWASPLTLGLLVASLSSAVLVRLRRAALPGAQAALRSAVRPTGAEMVVTSGGGLAGLLMLLPVYRQGFATTIAGTNSDGWGYASMVDWLKENPFPREVAFERSEPLTYVPWNTAGNGFGVGFEHVGAMVATLLGRDGFEVVNAVAAVAIAAAVGGWALLAAELRGRLTGREAALVVLAVASPTLVLAYAENYVTQFVSLCLWPFAVAAFVRFGARPGWRALLITAVAVAALVGIYPGVAPWLLVSLVVAALLAPPPPAGTWMRHSVLGAKGLAARAGRAGVLVGAVGVASGLVGLIQVVRAERNLRALDATTVLIGDPFSTRAHAALFVGAADAFSLLADASLGAVTLAALAVLAGVYGLALVPSRALGRHRPAVAALAAAVAVATAAAVVQYGLRDERPYHLYKALLTGGALLAGLAVVGLLPGPGERFGRLRFLGLGCCAVVWLPVASDSLSVSSRAAPGFRATDIAMGRELAGLTAGATVLVDGPAAEPYSFQLRMVGAYFGALGDVRMLGLGSTGTYFAPGGQPEWRPSRPWTHVLSTRPTPVVSPRRQLWRNRVYRLHDAPALDVTTYGSGWYPARREGGVASAGAWGLTELVVANRSAVTRRVRVRMQVSSYAMRRTGFLVGPQRSVQKALPPDAPTWIEMPVALPRNSVASLSLTAHPGPVTAPDGRPLMLRVQRIGVSSVLTSSQSRGRGGRGRAGRGDRREEAALDEAGVAPRLERDRAGGGRFEARRPDGRRVDDHGARERHYRPRDVTGPYRPRADAHGARRRVGRRLDLRDLRASRDAAAALGEEVAGPE